MAGPSIEDYLHLPHKLMSRSSLSICSFCFADFVSTVPPELESVLRLNTVEYFVTRRPWLGMCDAATLVALILMLCLAAFVCQVHF